MNRWTIAGLAAVLLVLGPGGTSAARAQSALHGKTIVARFNSGNGQFTHNFRIDRSGRVFSHASGRRGCDRTGSWAMLNGGTNRGFYSCRAEAGAAALSVNFTMTASYDGKVLRVRQFEPTTNGTMDPNYDFDIETDGKTCGSGVFMYRSAKFGANQRHAMLACRIR